jgi:hypothetical protein
MATLIDIEATPEADLVDDEQTTEVQEPESVEAAAPAVEDKPEPEDIPEKYQGKDVKDLIRMHQEAEKAMGKQGSEVGELRKIVDEFISNQLTNTAPKQEPEPEDDTDWYLDPDAALEKKLEQHPTIKAMKESQIESAKEANLSKLQQKHPDYQDILQEEGFAEWIGKSKVRSRLLVEADQNYDLDAADELFSLYKERKQLSKETVEVDKASRKEEIKAASTGGARGAATTTPAKKYRRSDIIDLMRTDPEKYQALAPELLLAYRDKRVY